MLPSAVEKFLHDNNVKHNCFCLAINDKHQIIQYFGSAKLLGINPPTYKTPIIDFIPGVMTESFEEDFEIPFYNIDENNVVNLYFLKKKKISFLLLIDKSEIFSVTKKYQQYAHDDNISKNKFKKLARDLEKAQQKLNKSNQEKATLIAMMSHEIGTPLTSIIGYSELLLKNGIKSDKGLNIIHRNAIYLQEMIENTLLFGSSEAGATHLKIKETSIQDLFNNLKTTLEPAARAKKLTLQMFHTENEKINIDVARTKQILINLINNAIKYTEEGSVELKYSRINGNYVFSVVDTGIGVPEALKKSIFCPWKRVGESNEAGSGIGLFISQKLTEAIGASLKLKYSNPEFGSIFQLIIPVSEQAQSDKKTITQISTKHSGKAILIIDDDEDILELISVFIQPCELNIYTATNYPDAQSILNQHQIDIILTDLNLGAIKATSFIEKIKSAHKNTPVVLMTALPSESIKLNFKKIGFDDIVAKPINKEELVTIILQNIE